METGQLAQVGQTQGWLASWDQPEAVSARNYMTWMTASGGHDHGMSPAAGGAKMMPGMASAEEIAKLRTLSGTELDVFFLQLMLRHHQGGLPMAQYAAQHAAQPYVRNMAEKIVNAQTFESGMMTQFLTERGAKPLS